MTNKNTERHVFSAFCCVENLFFVLPPVHVWTVLCNFTVNDDCLLLDDSTMNHTQKHLINQIAAIVPMHGEK
jgi:hypothetical protein